MVENTSTLKVNVFLHKDSVDDYEDCLNPDIDLSDVSVKTVKSDIGLPGKIYIHDAIRNPVEWEADLEKLTDEPVYIEDNVSNRAVVIFEYNDLYFSLTFGYGRYMLDYSTIVNNFGLKVAANIIDSNKVKSLNSTSYESKILRIQKNVPIHMNQDQFGINKNLEMLKSVAGSPSSESTAKFIAGSDSLTVNRLMSIEDIKESIIFYYDKYHSNEYVDKGFEWIDNVNEVEDKSIIEDLDNKLYENLLTEDSRVVIAINEIVDIEMIEAFTISGIRENIQPSLDLNYKNYISYLFENYQDKSHTQLIGKLKRDVIQSIDNQGIKADISNVYDGIIFETELNDASFLLDSGSWFQINPDFYERIIKDLKNISTNNISLKEYETRLDKGEGDYNKRLGGEPNLVTLDTQNFVIKNFGNDSVEPADLISRDKQLIHVKRRDNGGSSVLSHWAAQGLVSAELLNIEMEFREHINDKVEDKFGKDFITQEHRNNNFEIVYALVIEDDNEIIESIPFFSLVNLHQTIEKLRSRDFQISFSKIQKIDNKPE